MHLIQTWALRILSHFYAAVVQLAENKSVVEIAMLLCSQVCQLATKV